VRGDANIDGRIDASDLVFTLGCLFLGGLPSTAYLPAELPGVVQQRAATGKRAAKLSTFSSTRSRARVGIYRES